MILEHELACVVVVCAGAKWVRLHFHRHCYVAWERIEVDSSDTAKLPHLRPDRFRST
jgi:hypothetical protein